MRQFLRGSALVAVAGMMAGVPIGRPADGLPGALLDGAPPPDAPHLQAAAAALARPQTHLLEWMADGRLLLSVGAAGSEQLAGLAEPLGTPQRLSEAVPLARGGQAQPFSASALTFLAPAAGDTYQLWLLPLGAGEPSALSGPAHFEGPALWSHAGTRVAYVSDLADSGSFDAFVQGLQPRTGAHLLAGGGVHWRLGAWSGDDARLLLIGQSPGLGDRLVLAQLSDGALQPLPAAAPGRAAVLRIGQARFSADGRSVLYTVDRDGGALQLRRLEIASGHEELLAGGEQDITLFDVSADGRQLAYVQEDLNGAHVVLLDVLRREPMALAALAAERISALCFEPNGQRIAVGTESIAGADAIWVLDPAGAGPVRWAPPGDAGPSPLRLQAGRFPAWGGHGRTQRTLPVVVYRPEGGTVHPVLVSLNAALSSTRGGFDPLLTYLVDTLGYAVIAPSLQDAAGTDSAAALRDIGALLVWIGAQPDLARDRIVVLGSGAAATLALQAGALYGDRIRGEVLIDPQRETLQVSMATLNRPVLLAQGAGQSPARHALGAELIAELRRHGVEAWWLQSAREIRSATLLPSSSEADYFATVAEFLARQAR